MRPRGQPNRFFIGSGVDLDPEDLARRRELVEIEGLISRARTRHAVDVHLYRARRPLSPARGDQFRADGYDAKPIGAAQYVDGADRVLCIDLLPGPELAEANGAPRSDRSSLWRREYA